MKFTEATRDEVDNVRCTNQIEITYDALKAAFGSPHSIDLGMTVWRLKFENGVVGVIMWRRGNTWMIGGHSLAAWTAISEVLYG